MLALTPVRSKFYRKLFDINQAAEAEEVFLYMAKLDCTISHTTAPRLLYDRKAAAHQLSISIRSLDYLIANKRLDTRRNGRKVLVTHASLVRFAAANHYDAIADASARE
jgi:hypothetical protein